MVGGALSEGVVAARIVKWEPHPFRHSFATRLLEPGDAIPTVQELVGPVSVEITRINTHVWGQGRWGEEPAG